MVRSNMLPPKKKRVPRAFAESMGDFETSLSNFAPPTLERGTTAASMLTLELGNEEAENWVGLDDDDLISIKPRPKSRGRSCCVYLCLTMTLICFTEVLVSSGKSPRFLDISVVPQFSLLSSAPSPTNAKVETYGSCDDMLNDLDKMTQAFLREFIDRQAHLFFHETLIEGEDEGGHTTDKEMKAEEAILNESTIAQTPNSDDCAGHIIRLLAHEGRLTALGDKSCTRDTQTEIVVYDEANLDVIATSSVGGSYLSVHESNWFLTVMTKLHLPTSSLLTYPKDDEDERSYRRRAKSHAATLESEYLKVVSRDMEKAGVKCETISTMEVHPDSFGDDLGLLMMSTIDMRDASLHGSNGLFVFGTDWEIVQGTKGLTVDATGWEKGSSADSKIRLPINPPSTD